jgi:hypothetical protein
MLSIRTRAVGSSKNGFLNLDYETMRKRIETSFWVLAPIDDEAKA